MAEGEDIARMLPGAELLSRGHALKGRVRATRRPRILHLATHGYAYSEADPDSLTAMAALTSPDLATLSSRFANLSRNPELKSGLALAGANTWLRHDDPGAEAETGLLTVADIAGLDLDGTELVVLSACDTGIGEIGNPEGHASVRAAFLRAGARTVVASLWKVKDDATRVLMTRYYALLLDGVGKAEALRTAQLDMYTAAAPVAMWGAFVCFGDTSPLTSS